MCDVGQGSFSLILFVLGELNKIKQSKVQSKLLRMLALSISLCVYVCVCVYLEGPCIHDDLEEKWIQWQVMVTYIPFGWYCV